MTNHAARIGITGHQRLDDESQWPGVRSELKRILEDEDTPLVGLTSLAIGADQLFAEVVLELGGSIEAVIPFEGYESKFESGLPVQKYRGLLARAAKVTTLPPRQTEEESYFDAGKLVVEAADKLVAIWDGKEAEGLGGTADVVSYAKRIGRPVILISVRS